MEYDERFQINPKIGIALFIIVVLIVVFTAVFFLTMWVNVPVGNAVEWLTP